MGHSGYVILSCVLFFLPCWAASSGRLDHGSVCVTDQDCESRNVLLQCIDGLCTCPTSSPDVFLDPDTLLCSATVGTSCHRTRSNLDSEEELNPVKHYVPCLRDATCSRPFRICQCDSHHYSAPDGRSCPLQKSINEACTEENECDTFRYLNCVQGRCACSPDMDYHPQLGTCFVPIGQNCTSRGNYYENPVFPSRYDSCPLNAECIGGVCTCRPFFTKSSDGTCGRDHGSRCNSATQSCSDTHLSCQNQKCACKYPLHQVYEPGTGRCLSRVPGPCNANISSEVTDPAAAIYCVSNAVCSLNEEGSGQCRCGRRYGQDSGGYCLKPHGYDCELDRECSNIQTTLLCINNQCSCPDLLQIYDRETGTCQGKIGSRCKLIASRDDTTFTTEPNPCVPNAYCKAFGPEKDFGLVGECVPTVNTSASGTVTEIPGVTVTESSVTVTESPVTVTESPVTVTESPVTVTTRRNHDDEDDYEFPDGELDGV